MRCSVHHAPPHLAPINVRQLLTIEMNDPSEFFKVNLLDLNILKKCSITCNKGNYSKIFKATRTSLVCGGAIFEYFNKSKPRLQF